MPEECEESSYAEPKASAFEAHGRFAGCTRPRTLNFGPLCVCAFAAAHSHHIAADRRAEEMKPDIRAERFIPVSTSGIVKIEHQPGFRLTSRRAQARSLGGAKELPGQRLCMGLALRIGFRGDLQHDLLPSSPFQVPEFHRYLARETVEEQGSTPDLGLDGTIASQSFPPEALHPRQDAFSLGLIEKFAGWYLSREDL